MNIKRSKIAKLAALSLAAATAFSLTACGGSDKPNSDEGGHEEVTVRAVLPLTNDWPEMDGFNESLLPALEKSAPWVNVEVAGSSEVVPANDQAEALSTGAYDMVPIYPAYAEGFMPGISAALISRNLPSEERESGAAKVYNEIFFNPNGTTYLGAQHGGDQYAIYLGKEACDNFDPEEPSLQGMTIRGGDQYKQAVNYLGGSIVNMPVGDVYNSLERGVIDGYGMSQLGMPAVGTAGITSCRIEPLFKTNSTLLGVNTAWWESLDDETREGIQEAVEESEPDMEKKYAQKLEGFEDWLEENNIKNVKLPEEKGQEFIDAIDEKSWDEALTAKPEVQKLRDIWDAE